MEFWQLVLIWAFGGTSHFYYEWLGKPRWAGYVFPNSESIWEHLKLGVWPLMIALIWRAAVCEAEIWALGAALGASLAVWAFFMCAIYYTYTGILGVSSIPAVDILTFFVGTAAAWAVGKYLLSQPISAAWGIIGFAAAALFAALLLGFSHHAPSYPIFRDPRQK